MAVLTVDVAILIAQFLSDFTAASFKLGRRNQAHSH
jgi:hypothetical protein